MPWTLWPTQMKWHHTAFNVFFLDRTKCPTLSNRILFSLRLFHSLQQSGAAGEGEGKDAENEIRRKKEDWRKPRGAVEQWPSSLTQTWQEWVNYQSKYRIPVITPQARLSLSTESHEKSFGWKLDLVSESVEIALAPDCNVNLMSFRIYFVNAYVGMFHSLCELDTTWPLPHIPLLSVIPSVILTVHTWHANTHQKPRSFIANICLDYFTISCKERSLQHCTQISFSPGVNRICRRHTTISRQ